MRKYFEASGIIKRDKDKECNRVWLKKMFFIRRLSKTKKLKEKFKTTLYFKEHLSLYVTGTVPVPFRQPFPRAFFFPFFFYFILKRCASRLGEGEALPVPFWKLKKSNIPKSMCSARGVSIIKFFLNCGKNPWWTKSNFLIKNVTSNLLNMELPSPEAATGGVL